MFIQTFVIRKEIWNSLHSILDRITSMLSCKLGELFHSKHYLLVLEISHEMEEQAVLSMERELQKISRNFLQDKKDNRHGQSPFYDISKYLITHMLR